MISDIELPEPDGFMDQSIGGDMAYIKGQLIDYGNRRAAQAVLAERERCAQVASQQVMTSWNTETDAHNACAMKITSAIRKGGQA